MELPVVATVEIQGERVVVRSAPLSLVARLAQAPDDVGLAGVPPAARYIDLCHGFVIIVPKYTEKPSNPKKNEYLYPL